jgi:pyridoxamine 5'-phosphate oxidase
LRQPSEVSYLQLQLSLGMVAKIRTELALSTPRQISNCSIDKALCRTDFNLSFRVEPGKAMDALNLIPDTADPIGLFRQWFDEAKRAEHSLSEAMSLATATPDGKPSLRLVLLKDINDGGFVFYTNTESRKGGEISANPQAALCFHWKSLRRQVRVEGALQPVTTAEADAYWATRPHASQVAGWASQQSRSLPTRAQLQANVAEFETRFAGEPVPRPPQWTGFRLVPEVIEFWHDVPSRLHDRLVFHANGSGWRTERLYP